jgi:hypothetical protein
MNRRHFLKITFAAAAVTAVSIRLDYAVAERLPRIMGDGVHDDTAGLQAALNCKQFVCDSDLVQVTGSNVAIRGGRYFVTDTLTLHPNNRTTIHGADFHFDCQDQTKSMLYVPKGGSDTTLIGCHFTTEKTMRAFTTFALP